MYFIMEKHQEAENVTLFISHTEGEFFLGSYSLSFVVDEVEISQDHNKSKYTWYQYL